MGLQNPRGCCGTAQEGGGCRELLLWGKGGPFHDFGDCQPRGTFWLARKGFSATSVRGQWCVTRGQEARCQRDLQVSMLVTGLESQVPGVTVSWLHPLAGHLFDLSSLSGRAGYTAAYSEKGLVYISVCGDNENCAPGVGECPRLPHPPAPAPAPAQGDQRPSSSNSGSQLGRGDS